MENAEVQTLCSAIKKSQNTTQLPSACEPFLCGTSQHFHQPNSSIDSVFLSFNALRLHLVPFIDVLFVLNTKCAQHLMFLGFVASNWSAARTSEVSLATGHADSNGRWVLRMVIFCCKLTGAFLCVSSILLYETSCIWSLSQEEGKATGFDSVQYTN